jgi:hypothetical protein
MTCQNRGLATIGVANGGGILYLEYRTTVEVKKRNYLTNGLLDYPALSFCTVLVKSNAMRVNK